MEQSIDVNRRILNKIEESEIQKEVKDFLKKILFIELENFESGYSRYSKRYEIEIMKYAKRYKEDK